MLTVLSLLVMTAGAALRATAENLTSTQLDLGMDVQYAPTTAWLSTRNSPCGEVSRFTSTVGGFASFQFTGSLIGLSFERTNESGIVRVQIDDDAHEYDLFSDETACGLFVEEAVQEGNHTATITLTGELNSRGDGVDPVMHITGLMSWAPVVVTPPPHHRLSGAAIAGITIGSVIGAALLAGGLFFFIRRYNRSKDGRHSFNPTTICATELSPRRSSFAESIDVKMQPYARMEDETDAVDMKRGRLDLPPPTYVVSAAGLRARSRSPVPHSKDMA